jgi:hypothetical protein
LNIINAGMIVLLMIPIEKGRLNQKVNKPKEQIGFSTVFKDIFY